MKKSLMHFLALVAVLALVLGACGTPAAAPTATSAPAPTAVPPTKAPAPTAVPPTAAPADWAHATSAEEGGGMDALIAAAQKEGQLTAIALPRDWCDYGDAIDTFQAKYGLTVTVLDPNAGSSTELEAIKNNKDNPGPQAPDVVDIGLSSGPSAKDEGLITPYKVAGWDTISGLKDEVGYWYTSYGGVLIFQVNKDLVTNIPQDWSDLLKPEYKGQVALAGDPRLSNQAAQTIMAAALANGGSVDDVGPGLEYFKQLAGSGNLLVLISNSGTFAKGESPITFQWDYLAKAARDDLAGNPEVEIVYPKSGILAGFYVQAISAYAPHPAAARLWEEFLYSDEGQQIWMKGYCVPSRFADMSSRGVIPQELLDKMPAPEVMGAAIFPTLDQLTKMRERVKNEYDQVVNFALATATPSP